MSKTLTNPETGQTYVFGTRGRKPKWVVEMLESQGFKPAPVTKKKKDKKKSEYFQWMYSDGYFANKLMVVAKNMVDALNIMNKAFKYPVSQSEIASENWKKSYYYGELSQGIYIHDDAYGDEDSWLPYKSLALKGE